MVFLKDPEGAFEDQFNTITESAEVNLKNSATASGRRALDTFLGKRRVGVHQTVTRTSYSATIRSGGRFIGGINSFEVSQDRDVEEQFFIAPYPSCEPQAIIPLNVTGRKLKISRYELYRRPFETRFGDFDLTKLANQRNKFSIQEKLVDPLNRSKMYAYTDCYFTSIGYKYSAEGDMVVMYDAEVIFKERLLVS